MSEPMSNARRAAIYTRDRNEPTPRQSRRLRHKENAASSERVIAGIPRFARMARRIESREAKRLRRESAGIGELVRERRSHPVSKAAKVEHRAHGVVESIRRVLRKVNRGRA